MLLDELVLQAADMCGLRRKLDGFAEGHDPIHSLRHFAEGVFFLVPLVLQSERLHQVGLHLADRVAANNGDVQTMVLEIFESARLPLFMGF